jgi:hypothetical protein
LDVNGGGHVDGYSGLGGDMVRSFMGGYGCGSRRISDKEEASGCLGGHSIIINVGRVNKGGRIGGNEHVSGWELSLMGYDGILCK